MMDGINNVVSLADASAIISATGDNTTTILMGEPGIGKSALRNEILAQLGWGKTKWCT